MVRRPRPHGPDHAQRADQRGDRGARGGERLLKLRTGLLLGIALLVAGTITAVIVAIATVVAQAERANLDDRLARGERGLVELVQYRQAAVKSDCHIVANEPQLRAVVGTHETTRETIVDVIEDLKKGLGNDLFELADPDGNLMSTDALPDPGVAPTLRQARTSGDAAAIWILRDRPYLVHACRMAFGSETIGIVVVGRQIRDALVEVVTRQTGSIALIALDGRPVAVSTRGDFAAVRRAVGLVPAEVVVGGTTYVAIAGTLPGYTGKRDLSYLLLRSLDEALAPRDRLIRTVLVIAALALVAASVLAFLLARRLSRPVDRLVELTQRIAAGKLDLGAPASGAKELRALARAMNAMMQELATSRQQRSEKERLEREMEIAQKIQTSMLPRNFEVPGLEIAAHMTPADEVGGDYYDILPVHDGCWIGIGDVAGHGLTAGLEMMMVQSVVAALVRRDPDAAPRDVVTLLNRVMYENIRERLQQDEHMTLTLLRYRAGTLTFAGAHEEILVFRAARGVWEQHATPGTWIAGMPDVSAVTTDQTLALERGDIVVLHTDGISEARNVAREQFGTERLCQTIERHAHASVATMRDAVVAAVAKWQPLPDDDFSLVVLRVR